MYFIMKFIILFIDRKFDDQTLKAAKQREEHMKRAEEKIKKAAAEKKLKEEKQKLKEIMMKEEMLEKKRLAEQRLAEINAKRKQADEAKLLKLVISLISYCIFVLI